MIHIQSGTVARHNTWVSKTNFAPILQSSPTKDGKTIVLSPQGMHPIMTTAGYTARGRGNRALQSMQIPNIIAGIATSRIREKITVLASGMRSLSEKEEMTSPVTIILSGPTHPDASSRVLDTTAGRGIAEMPKIMPAAIATVIGVIIFLHDLGLLLKRE